MAIQPDIDSVVVNGVHDMGGMHGFGPIVIETDEPVFHAEWEGKVRAIFSETVGRYYNLDEFRHVIERMEPAAYLEAVYYERWLHAVETLLDEKGVLAAGAAAPAPQAPHKRPAKLPAPRVKAGDRVDARARALESLLIEKGLLTGEQVEGIVWSVEQDIGPMLGARVVARAWVDPAFRRRLIEDANAAVGELGLSTTNLARLSVVANE